MNFVNLRCRSGYTFLKHPDSREKTQIYIRIYAFLDRINVIYNDSVDRINLK